MIVERIFVVPPSGGPQVERDRVVVTAGAGIEGDRYFGRHEEPGQNLTLVEAEEIEAFLQAHQRPQDFSVMRRNLVTRGVRLNELVGRRFMVGNVELRGVELCEPCLGLGQVLSDPGLTPGQVVKDLVHRAGLRANVVSGGVIEQGARITPPA